MAKRPPSPSSFPHGAGRPALSALAAAGINDLAQLTQFSERQILALHGVGPKALGVLRGALQAQGLDFAR